MSRVVGLGCDLFKPPSNRWVLDPASLPVTELLQYTPVQEYLRALERFCDPPTKAFETVLLQYPVSTVYIPSLDAEEELPATYQPNCPDVTIPEAFQNSVFLSVYEQIKLVTNLLVIPTSEMDQVGSFTGLPMDPGIPTFNMDSRCDEVQIFGSYILAFRDYISKVPDFSSLKEQIIAHFRSILCEMELALQTSRKHRLVLAENFVENLRGEMLYSPDEENLEEVVYNIFKVLRAYDTFVKDWTALSKQTLPFTRTRDAEMESIKAFGHSIRASSVMRSAQTDSVCLKVSRSELLVEKEKLKDLTRARARNKEVEKATQRDRPVVSPEMQELLASMAQERGQLSWDGMNLNNEDKSARKEESLLESPLLVSWLDSELGSYAPSFFYSLGSFLAAAQKATDNSQLRFLLDLLPAVRVRSEYDLMALTDYLSKRVYPSHVIAGQESQTE
ncbi:hypothetical protein GNI_124510 [Gregarina niphandrodes]|uniref:Uncharacterized protein n=1 Tax=Gregarina niphandrodes TaxID=110365 RepID=A0A023B279_GRENI|nr:hypothetical protein GNI_124510 [Gregarina niphandrodes]EZG51416.1 hypothetical protein GNI_124510 [Gregarina niphandrodes]|eukprot:XP_011131971.1 hypothetical protein GNI_124510 [Gregarina niphandrodes]